METEFWSQLASSHGRAETRGGVRDRRRRLPALLARGAEYARVTAADVQQAAATYLAPGARSVVIARTGAGEAGRARRRPRRRRSAWGAGVGGADGRRGAARAGRRAGRRARQAGPAGSLLIVEDDHSVPLVHVIVASRSGSAADPRHREGLTNLAAEWRCHGAGGRSRSEIDEALDALGGTLRSDRAGRHPVRGRGAGAQPRRLPGYRQRHPDPPDLRAGRARPHAPGGRGQIDESRNDDRLLCGRFFMRNVYGDHPYGHPLDGLPASLDAATAAETAAHFRQPLRAGAT